MKREYKAISLAGVILRRLPDLAMSSALYPDHVADYRKISRRTSRRSIPR